MNETEHNIRLAPARPEDVPLILEMIRELAEYENLTRQLEATIEGLTRYLFGPDKAAEAVMLYQQEVPPGTPCISTISRPSSADPEFFWKTCLSGRGSAAWGWAGPCSTTWAGWPGKRIWAGWNSPSWTGTSRPSIFIRKWARTFYRTGGSAGSPDQAWPAWGKAGKADRPGCLEAIPKEKIWIKTLRGTQA